MDRVEIRVGDRVVTNSGETGKVVFVDGGLAKVILDNTLQHSFPIVTLERIEIDGFGTNHGAGS